MNDHCIHEQLLMCDRGPAGLDPPPGGPRAGRERLLLRDKGRRGGEAVCFEATGMK